MFSKSKITTTKITFTKQIYSTINRRPIVGAVSGLPCIPNNHA